MKDPSTPRSRCLSACAKPRRAPRWPRSTAAGHQREDSLRLDLEIRTRQLRTMVDTYGVSCVRRHCNVKWVSGIRYP